VAPLFALHVLIVVSFPEGRLVSRTRRVVALGAVVAATIACVFGVLSQDTLDPPLEHVTPAFSIIGTPGRVVTAVGILGLFACLIACAVDVVLRLHGARGLERRQRICFAHVALLVPFSLAVGPGWESTAPSACR
jgi:hypothetical protein